jgi:hypothetical protein
VEFENIQANNASYACWRNRTRNVVSNEIFLKYVQSYHPRFGSNDTPPHTGIIIKGILSKQGVRKSHSFHNYIYNTCGDSDITTRDQRHLDPCLKLFAGCPVMVATNKQKQSGPVKGSTATFVGLKLKRDVILRHENWDGYSIYTVEANEVDYIICKFTTGPKIGKTFKLHIDAITISATFLEAQSTQIIGGITLTQFPIVVDNATTVHKLQGMSKDILVICEFSYNTPNWIYVVLSRLRTLKGLFLKVTLDKTKRIGPPKELLQEHDRLRTLESWVLEMLNRDALQ